MATLNYQQLQQLWRQAGGPAQLAPTMAAIALAESGGRTDALNNNPSTGDYSVGLWQINYYGPLQAARTARYGPPDSLRLGPAAALRNARAAVSLAADGNGLGNWTTYTTGAYLAHLQGGNPPPAAAAPAGRPRPGQPAGGGIDTAWYDWLNPSIFPVVSVLESEWKALAGALSGPWDVLKVFVWLADPRTWLRIFEALLGVVIMLLSLRALAFLLISREAAAAIPGGGRLRRAFPVAGFLKPSHGRRRGRERNGGAGEGDRLGMFELPPGGVAHEGRRQGRHPVKRQTREQEPQRGRSFAGPNQRRLRRAS